MSEESQDQDQPEEEQPQAGAEEHHAPPIPDDDAVHPVKFEQLNLASDLEVERNVDRYDDVSLRISIELGRVTKPVSDILDWREGSLVETNKIQGESMEILVNGRLLGKGEVVVVGDNLAIRITELIKPQVI